MVLLMAHKLSVNCMMALFLNSNCLQVHAMTSCKSPSNSFKSSLQWLVHNCSSFWGLMSFISYIFVFISGANDCDTVTIHSLAWSWCSTVCSTTYRIKQNAQGCTRKYKTSCSYPLQVKSLNLMYQQSDNATVIFNEIGNIFCVSIYWVASRNTTGSLGKGQMLWEQLSFLDMNILILCGQHFQGPWNVQECSMTCWKHTNHSHIFF